MKTISLIYAASENHVIGVGGKLPWHLGADFKHFKQLSDGHTVVMGRKTYESIGRPLPGRQNIVLSHNPDFSAPGVETAYSLDDAINKARSNDVFVIGGTKVFEEALPLATQVFVTRVHAIIDGDTTFEPDLSHWLEESHESFKADEHNDFDYSFINYVRQ
jgi:dihydrofolate reductase